MPIALPATAMVMAAGLGTRMQPLTLTLPKPLIKVGNATLIDRALDWLDRSGIRRAVVNSAYKAELLEAHIAGRRRPEIIISRESVPLETGGGLVNALPLLGDSPFFCVNSDVICLDGASPALHCLASRWQDEAMDALLLLHPTDKAIGYGGVGDFFLGEDGSLHRRGSDAVAPYVFTGVQMLHPRLFRSAPEGAFSINRLYNRLSADGVNLPRIVGLAHDGEWLHVGDPDGLAQAERFLRSQTVTA